MGTVFHAALTLRRNSSMANDGDPTIRQSNQTFSNDNISEEIAGQSNCRTPSVMKKVVIAWAISGR